MLGIGNSHPLYSHDCAVMVLLCVCVHVCCTLIVDVIYSLCES